MRVFALPWFFLALVASCKTTRSLELRVEELPAPLQVDAEPIVRAFADHPNDASVLYQVASLFAAAHRPEDALEALRRMAAFRTGVDPRPRDFEAVAALPEFQRIVAGIRAEFAPVRRARELFALAEADLVPEGIAWSARTKRFYLGSIKRKIITVDETGKAETFVAPATGGMGVVVGIRVDDARGELWATSVRLGAEPKDAMIGLLRFDLTDGALRGRYSVGDGSDDLVNDVAVGPDGVAYATLTNAGTIVRVDPRTDQIERILPPRSIPDANGITVSPAGDALYVASWRDVYRVDLSSRRVRTLAKPTNVASGCFDGLYATGRDLVGIQNCVHATGRVVRLALDAKGERIESARVLESYNPLFEGVTTAAVTGDNLVFVANTQFRKAGRAGAKFDPLHVLTLSLRD